MNFLGHAHRYRGNLLDRLASKVFGSVLQHADEQSSVAGGSNLYIGTAAFLSVTFFSLPSSRSARSAIGGLEAGR